MNGKNGYLMRTVDGSVVRFTKDSDIKYLRKYRWRLLKNGRLELVRELRRGEDDWVEAIERPRQALAGESSKKARLR